MICHCSLLLRCHWCSWTPGAQEDCCLKSAQANSLRDPILKIPNTEEGWWSGSSSSKCEALSSSLSTTHKKDMIGGLAVWLKC
jgi:hypothetical protein